MSFLVVEWDWFISDMSFLVVEWDWFISDMSSLVIEWDWFIVGTVQGSVFALVVLFFHVCGFWGMCETCLLWNDYRKKSV